MKINSYHRWLAVCMVAMSCAWGVRADNPTALKLIKEGNHYVSDEAKDKVVEIRSDKSVGSMTPNIWYIVYYDVDATFKATEVKLGAGKKLDVKRPARMLEFASDASKRLDMQKVKLDSDEALSIAMKEPLLANLKLKASQLWLQHGDSGPVWRVRLWAAKLKNPNDDADIGDVYIASDNGSVVRRDLHIERVD